MLWDPLVVTGRAVDALTAVRSLAAAAWHDRRERLEKLGGAPVLE